MSSEELTHRLPVSPEKLLLLRGAVEKATRTVDLSHAKVT